MLLLVSVGHLYPVQASAFKLMGNFTIFGMLEVMCEVSVPAAPLHTPLQWPVHCTTWCTLPITCFLRLLLYLTQERCMLRQPMARTQVGNCLCNFTTLVCLCATPSTFERVGGCPDLLLGSHTWGQVRHPP